MLKLLKKLISRTLLSCFLISVFNIHIHFNANGDGPRINNDRGCQDHYHSSSKECGECITKNEKYSDSYVFKSTLNKNYSTLKNHKTINPLGCYIFHNSYCRPPPNIKMA